jgi:hypothetical protein
MPSPRADHTATVLPSGEVLVAGGWDGASETASAVLFDPATERWTATSPMSRPRRRHRATLLQTGDVLVTGGDGSAELYHPSTGTWTPTGSMTRTDTAGHTATLLSSGMVLVTGGGRDPSNMPAFSPVAELYDPRTGAWSRTGDMRIGRGDHSAVLLASGEVLVVGGRTRENDTSVDGEQSELYDPVTGTWAAGGASSGSAIDQTATLLPTGVVAVVGGSHIHFGGADIRDVIDLYTPGSGWASTGMLVGRALHTATLLPSGDLLIAGGNRARDDVPMFGPSTDSVELYGAQGSAAAAPLSTPRTQHAAVLLRSGDVLVVGGVDATRAVLASAEIYRQ